MIKNEGELAKNVQTVRDHCSPNLESKECSNAFKEVSDFMQQKGNLQDNLSSRNLLKMDGNSLIIDPNIYPSEKSEK